MSEGLATQDHARRLIRARNWHLVAAGRQRREVAAHEAEAERLAAEILALGFDPQPPMAPRAVGDDNFPQNGEERI
jgi:hypothetical protein